MRIIPFSLKYKPQCIALFEDNTPVYFAPEEKEIFDNFLGRQNPPYHFYLVESDNDLIIACGGIKEELGNRSAMLRWDIVKSEQQKHGVGSFLTRYRIARICENPKINVINLGTTQKTFSFYEKMGFQVKSVKKDGIALGLDEYYMEQEITDELRSKFAKY